MKQNLIYLVQGLVILATISCDDDEPKTIPTVTTAEISSVTTSTASGGGEILDNGNVEIISSGLVYSSTNSVPTISDSKVEGSATEGAFTSVLENLNSSTIYYVRAYATNSVGTGYGEVEDFTTGNAPPTAIDLSISGAAQVLEVLTASYTFSDGEGDAEASSTIQWYVANDATGSNENAIAGQTGTIYAVQASDEFKYIRFGITPKASSGISLGQEVRSTFVGPVQPEPTTVTFVYNGASVTYGIIISPVTGRRWLDRNLGAPNAATAFNDFANYGDAFQWGRKADGHQLVNRGSTTGTTSGVNATTTTLSPIDTPPNALFIVPSVEPFDWRDPQNNSLWQGAAGTNNPCPMGFRIPTKEEWVAESLTTVQGAYTQLKLTRGGQRNDASFAQTTSGGYYWSSTVDSASPTRAVHIVVYTEASGIPFEVAAETRYVGKSCRCIRN